MPPNTANAANTADATQAVEALQAHHRRLTERLTHLADAVIAAAADGDAATEAVALFGWYRAELLPHIKSEEAAIYTRGREREASALLVQALLAEHARLRELFEELDAVDDAAEAAAMAGAAKAVFVGHVTTENELLLPALQRAAVDLADVLEAKPELAGGARREPEAIAKVPEPTGGSAPTIEAIAGTEDLDVRALSHQARHGIILGKMQALTDSGTLVLINDHDPLPLRYQADAMWPGEFEWTYLDEGPEEWRVAITRA